MKRQRIDEKYNKVFITTETSEYGYAVAQVLPFPLQYADIKFNNEIFTTAEVWYDRIFIHLAVDDTGSPVIVWSDKDPAGVQGEVGCHFNPDGVQWEEFDIDDWQEDGGYDD